MIKAGIIGFGYMGHYHYEKLKCFSGVKVTAVCDIDKNKTDEARSLGLAAYEQLSLFLKENMEFVVICTPNQFHMPMALAALEAGYHVLCEKPAVLNEGELKRVKEAAKKAGRFFTVHHNRRWDTDYMTVKAALGSGEIGRAVTVESRVLGQRGVVFGWRALPECGGGMLYDWGPHLIDQMLQMFPGVKVNAVSAQLQSVLTPSVDDFVFLSLFFENGVRANIQIGTMALQKLPRWYVYGDRGSLKLEDFSGDKGGIARIKGDVLGFESVLGQKNIGPSRTMAPLAPENLEEVPIQIKKGDNEAFHSNIIAAVSGGKKLYVSMDDIFRETKVIDAAFEASRKNEVLKVWI